MLGTNEVGSASDIATLLADRLPQNTSSTAKLIYKCVVWVGIETARRRGHSPATTEVVMHVPLEQVARACGISRVTVWRHLPALRELGLVDHRAHKATLRGESRNTGCVFRIRLSPHKGCKARLSYDDLKHPWRDLEADVRSGRTSYKSLQDDVQHTDQELQGLLQIEGLLAWTLPPTPKPEPVTPVCCTSQRADLESVLDVTGVDRLERGAAVDLGAQALAQALRDHAGVDWYRRLLWQLLRRYDATGDDYSYQVYLAAQRARADVVEGFARRGGALFVSRLRAAPWFDEVMRGPPVRVGARPSEVAHV